MTHMVEGKIREVSLGALFPELGLPAPVCDLSIRNVVIDSRLIKPGDLFVALKGLQVNGLDFIEHAAEHGAAAIVIDSTADVPAGTVQHMLGDAIVSVANLPEKVSSIAGFCYGQPSKHLKAIGVTGTNGKSTCVSLIAQLYSLLDVKAASMGTLGVEFEGRKIADFGMTTPDAATCQKSLAKLLQVGAELVALEVSSHGLDQHRVAGIEFDTGVYTNITHDHLDYHGSIENYVAAKQKLFETKGLKTAIINLDDPYTSKMVLAAKGHAKIYSYSLSHFVADVYATDLEFLSRGVEFKLVSPWGIKKVVSPLLGRFNVYNLISAITTLCANDCDFEEVLQAIPKLASIAGRMQKIGSDSDINVVVDYAHTPDALKEAISATRMHTSGKLCVVFGCGGNRDTAKRPVMAKIAEDLSDQVIVTSDNPRNENPEDIIHDICNGFSQKLHAVVGERESAIHYAIAQAKTGDTILIAGKGHETYQEVGNDRFDFDDVKISEEALFLRNNDIANGKMGLAEIAKFIGARLVGGDCDFNELSTDSRGIIADALFVALRGEHFDGHDFVAAAEQQGACAVVVDCEQPDLSIPQIIVSDTLIALGKIAAYKRKSFSGKVIAITGSSGKTTVKGMLFRVLNAKENALATQGNFNNQIGVPLTLMRMRSESFAVVELGTSNPGEIDYLQNLIAPDIALVTNIMPAHIGGFGSLDAIANEKSKVYLGLAKQAVINLDDAYAEEFIDLNKTKQCMGYALLEPANLSIPTVYAKNITWDAQGRASFDVCFSEEQASVQLNVPGQHNISNALAACACALACDFTLLEAVSGLSEYLGEKGRMNIDLGLNDASIIDDTYNANPGSVKAAIDSLSLLEGKKILVLGDMGELGSASESSHQEVGVHATNKKIDSLYACGPLASLAAESFGSNGYSFLDKQSLVEALRDELERNTTVLVKGSRSAKMEDVVHQISLTGESLPC